jgi:DNA polymerase III subunit delta'
MMGRWGLIGHDGPLQALEAYLAAGRLPHAFLIVGPPQVGKGTLALRLAQALNCVAPPKERPCGHCHQCRRIAQGIHPDVQVMSVEGGHREIRIAQVRELERSLYLKPYEGRMRVAIVDPADAMNLEAQNAFLKTLEEPPDQVTLVLVTAREMRLLPTVRSRCHRLALCPVPTAVLAAALEERGLPGAEAYALARLAHGRPGLAIALATGPSLAQRWQEEVHRAASIPRLGVRQRLEMAQAIAAEPDPWGPAWVLEVWRRWWRDVLLVQSGAQELVSHVTMMDELESLASSVPPAMVAPFLEAISRTLSYLEDNVNPRLALEALLLAAPWQQNMAA